MDEIPFNFIGFFLTIIPILIFVLFLSRWFERSFEDNINEKEIKANFYTSGKIEER
jgi:hypothetical protein